MKGCLYQNLLFNVCCAKPYKGDCYIKVVFRNAVLNAVTCCITLIYILLFALVYF